MSNQVRQVVVQLKSELSRIYGERLLGVYLYGSHARDEASEESDIDVLIILDRVDNYSQEIDQTSEEVARLSLQAGVTISRVFASEERWRTDQTNFFLNVREEAVPA